jgi:sulfatase maturation enzyme AslB (radical SAM superfamily)
MIYCSVTTNGICINPTQNLAPCCKWKFNTLNFGKLQYFPTLESSLDSEAFNELRNSHKEGDFTIGCGSCAFMESNNQRSKRQQYNANIDANTFMIDISIGNFCNLKCRMCNTLNSTAWYNDADILKERGYNYNWLQNRETNIISIEDIEKICSFIQSSKYHKFILELKGGEPLALKQTETLLTNISTYKNSKSVHIKMITNGTFKPKWLENLTEKFYKFDIHISFDGIKDVYEYIRGDKDENTWQKFVANCAYFKSLKNCEIRYNIVVQNLNVHQICLIYNMFESSEINFILLSGPVLLRANNIPEENKMNIINELIELRDKHNDSKLANIIDYIKQPADTEMIKKCIEYNTALDDIRGTSLFNVAPHMFEEDCNVW